MRKLFSVITLILSPAILGASQKATKVIETDYITQPIITATASRFEERKEVVTEVIPYPTSYEDDPETELDHNQVIQQGQNGSKIKIYKVLWWKGKEVDRVLDQVNIEEPTPEIISRGTKIVWRDHYTPDAGVISYWRKLNVWATSYDPNCLGCTGRTFTGTDVHVGVCAVDPRVIRLGTTFYVPGYGLCHAEDVGGAIKGNDVDLGFEDVRKGWWGAKYVDIYIIDNPFIPDI